MVRLVEGSLVRPASTPCLNTGDTAQTADNMVPTLFADCHAADTHAPPPASTMLSQLDPESPAGIAQAVVALLTPMITEAVNNTVLKGLEQLHREL